MCKYVYLVNEYKNDLSVITKWYRQNKLTLNEGPDGGVPKSIINKNMGSKSLINKIKSKSIKYILSESVIEIYVHL